MTKFAKLKIASDVSFKMILNSPYTNLPIRLAYPEGTAEEVKAAEPFAFIHVLSSDSVVAKSYEREQMDRRMSRRGKMPSAEEIEEETLLKFAKLVAGAKGGWMLADPATGEIIECACTESDAIDVLREAGWVLEQVIEAANSRANFKKA